MSVTENAVAAHKCKVHATVAGPFLTLLHLHFIPSWSPTHTSKCKTHTYTRQNRQLQRPIELCVFFLKILFINWRRSGCYRHQPNLKVSRGPRGGSERYIKHPAFPESRAPRGIPASYDTETNTGRNQVFMTWDYVDLQKKNAKVAQIFQSRAKSQRILAFRKICSWVL